MFPTDDEALQNHLARLIMPEVEALAQKQKISKRAAYYAYLGVAPRDLSGFSPKEIAFLKEQSGFRPIN